MQGGREQPKVTQPVLDLTLLVQLPSMGPFPSVPTPCIMDQHLLTCVSQSWTEVGGRAFTLVPKDLPKDDIEAQRGPVKFLRSHSRGSSPPACQSHVVDTFECTVGGGGDPSLALLSCNPLIPHFGL